MRKLAVALLVASACHHPAASGPAWPKSAGAHTASDQQEDGGESLEPRVASHPSVAIEIADHEPVDVATIPDDSVTPLVTTPDLAPPAPTGETMEMQVIEIQVGPGDGIITP
jgi:hypothetical protein